MHRPLQLKIPRNTRSGTVQLSTKVFQSPRQAILQPIENKITDNYLIPISDANLPLSMTSVPILHNYRHVDLVLQSLPHLPSILDEKSVQLLEKKLQICKKRCNFRNIDADIEAKSIKTDYLKELLTFISIPQNIQCCPAKVIDEFFDMIQCNIVRSVPEINPQLFYNTDFPIINDVDWPHVSYTYRILNQLLTVLKKDPHFTEEYVDDLLIRLASPDSYEREALQSFLSNYISVFPERSPNLLRKLGNKLLTYIENPENPFVVMSVLSFFQEQMHLPSTNQTLAQQTFLGAVLPLISTTYLPLYYRNMIQISEFFIEMDNSIIIQIVSYILKHWPILSAPKEISCIKIINFVLSKSNSKIFSIVFPKVFEVLIKCSELSNSWKLIEASFEFWCNPHLQKFIAENANHTYESILPYIMRISKIHYEPHIRNQAAKTLKILHDLDPITYDKYSNIRKANSKGPSNPTPLAPSSGRKLSYWKEIVNKASINDSTIDLKSQYDEIQSIFHAQIVDEWKLEKSPSLLRPVQRRNTNIGIKLLM